MRSLQTSPQKWLWPTASPPPQKKRSHSHDIFRRTQFNFLSDSQTRFYSHKQEAAKMFRQEYECTYGHLNCHCSGKDTERLTVLKLNYNNVQSSAFYHFTWIFLPLHLNLFTTSLESFFDKYMSYAECGRKKSRNIVTSSHPVLIYVWCNMVLEQWNLLETLTLTLATYTHVWAWNVEGGKGGRQNKRYPLRR